MIHACCILAGLDVEQTKEHLSLYDASSQTFNDADSSDRISNTIVHENGWLKYDGREAKVTYRALEVMKYVYNAPDQTILLTDLAAAMDPKEKNMNIVHPAVSLARMTLNSLGIDAHKILKTARGGKGKGESIASWDPRWKFEA